MYLLSFGQRKDSRRNFHYVPSFDWLLLSELIRAKLVSMHDLTSEVLLLNNTTYFHDVMPAVTIHSRYFECSFGLENEIRNHSSSTIFRSLVPHNCFGEQECESDGLAFNTIIIIMHINHEIRNPLKVAQNSFQHFPRRSV